MTTGTDVIRAALNSRARKMNAATLARDLGVPSETLDAFARGRTDLSPDTLKALARDLFHGHAEYDADIDRLRPATKTAPTPLGIHPPTLDPRTLPVYRAGPPPAAPSMVTKAVPKVSRPGWVE